MSLVKTNSRKTDLDYIEAILQCGFSENYSSGYCRRFAQRSLLTKPLFSSGTGTKIVELLVGWLAFNIKIRETFLSS